MVQLSVRRHAEFGLGMRLAVDQKRARAEYLLNQLRDDLGAEVVDDLIGADQSDEAGLAAQRDRVEHLQKSWATSTDQRPGASRPSPTPW